MERSAVTEGARQPNPAPTHLPGNAPKPRRGSVLGLPVDWLDMPTALLRIEAMLAAAREIESAQGTATAQIVTLNPEMVMASRREPPLRASILSAEPVVPDGIGISLAGWLVGAGWHGRVPGVDLMERIAARAAEQGYRLFLLGGAPGVAAAASQRLEARHPGLVVAGTCAGSPLPADEEDVVARIRAARAEVVFVAFGSPAQECWIARTRGALGAAVAVGVGGALDFAAGRVARAPRWMRRLGLEWLYRLGRQPWRWRRMLALPHFLVAVVWARVATPHRGRKGSTPWRV